ncbi:MAG: hypothetical protein WC728_16360 [Elusimicrobiota bacterium]
MSRTPIWTKLLSGALALSLILLSAGPGTTQALASVIQTAPVQAGPQAPIVPVVPGLGNSMGMGSASLGNTLAPSLNSVNTLPTNLPQVQVQAAPPSAVQAVAPASQKATPVTQAVQQKVQVVAPAAVVAPKEQTVQPTAPGSPYALGTAGSGIVPAVKQTLENGVQEIAKAAQAGPSSSFSALRSFFSGSRRVSAAAEAVDAGAASGNQTTAALSKSPLSDLETVAIDSSKPLKERQEAVKGIADQKTAEAKAALERVAEANPEGLAEDYEIHRSALRALAVAFNDVRSLRTISRKHKEQVLAELEKNKPELYVTDYDDTLEPFRAPITDEIAAKMKAMADSGIETVVLTDRSDVKRDERDTSIVDSLQSMTPEQRRAITLKSDRGTRTVLYDKKGEPVLVSEEKIEWSAVEKTAIQETIKVVAEKFGRGEFNGNTEFWSAYSYSMLLPVGMPAAQVKEAAALFAAELAKRGVDIPAVGRTVKNPADAPYITVSRIDKSIGVFALRKNRRVLETMRDLLSWGLPAKYAQKAYALANKLLPARPISAKRTVLVGDQFFDTRISDTGFVKGAPGGTVISVGAKADPRLDSVLVWPTEGHAASAEVMGAIAKRAPSEMDKKAVTGLFLQRSASIAAFIISSIAYPFLAVPAVGWAGYGILMSFGPLAGIATGPLNGLIADRLSARNAMALNTVIRVAMSLFLPVAAALGVLNFGTLLIASFANGWLLSSIMVTESAYTKRLAGAKNVFVVNNLAWMNYLAIQVVLGLILGVGSVVDKWNPVFAFTLNAIVNAVVVLPIIWFTMPTLSPAPKTLLSMEARLSALEKNGSEAEIAELKASIASREKELKATIEKNDQAAASATAELEKLQSQKTEGIKAWMEKRSEMSSLKADIGIRQKAVADAEKELSRKVATFKDRIMGTGQFLKKNWVSALMFGAGIGAYFLWQTTLPLIGALTFWITTTDGFKALWNGKGSEIAPREKALADQIEAAKSAGQPVDKAVKAEYNTWKYRLPKAMLYLAIIAAMMYPVQYLALPKIATLIAGESTKALVTGQLLGALFFGNLISNSGKAQLPEVKLPLVGRVPAEKLIQTAVVGLGMAWAYTGLVPGSVLAMAAAAIVIPALIATAKRLSNRAWVKFVGIGFSAIWLPYLLWGSPVIIPAIMLSMLAVGMTFGPAYSYLMGYFYGNAAKDKSGAMGGVQGSLFNAAVSGGYGVLALAASLMSAPYPALLAIIGAAYLLAGLAFWGAPKKLPGIPETLLEPKKAD